MKNTNSSRCEKSQAVFLIRGLSCTLVMMPVMALMSVPGLLLNVTAHILVTLEVLLTHY